MKKIIAFLCLGLLLVITILGYGETGKIFYTSESATYLTELSEINIVLSILALSVIGFSLFYKFSQKVIKVGLLFVFLVLWLFAGRKIGIKKFEDGRVNYGWYCIQTGELYLCDKQDSRCESIIANETSIEKSCLWRVIIKNEDVKKEVFIGPITWSKALEVLGKNIGN